MNSTLAAPLIGITTYGRNEAGQFYLPAAYVDAVREAGGMPILLPPGESDPAAVLDLVEGLIFSGGGDLGTDTYGGTAHPSLYMIDQERDVFELALARLALQGELPVLGICRGSQVLTVVSGHDLITHIPDEFGTALAHRASQRVPTEHSVSVVPDSRLADILGVTELCVPSWHHQAVRTAPDGWRVVAHAPDGVIEALECTNHPWMVALQWHPELSHDDPHRRIFQALVQAARPREVASRQNHIETRENDAFS